MFIHGTKKVLDQVKVQPETAEKWEGANDLFSWHANVVKLSRRNSVVLMNDKTQYAIVLYGLRAKDFSKLHTVIPQAIRAVWREEGIKESVIDDYLTQAGEVQFAKTKNRSLVARLNQACKEAEIFEDEIDPEMQVQTALSKRASRMLVGQDEDYIKPNETLYEHLQPFTDEAIFSIRAVEMNVQLMLESKEIWRRLIVPLNRTFPQFHKILQTAFDWWDYHLHEFYIFDEQETGEHLSVNHPAFTEEGMKPVIQLVNNEEAFDYPDDIPMKMETGVRLSDYIPAAKSLVYVYDFGDDWRHKIDVHRVIEDYASYHPVCLDGKGDAPPEDVGGEGGYLDFLEIMDNPDHPDHTNMKQWARNQLHQGIDLEMINRILQNR